MYYMMSMTVYTGGVRKTMLEENLFRWLIYKVLVGPDIVSVQHASSGGGQRWINPCSAGIILGNTEIDFHFLSSLNTEIAQVF